MFGFSIMSVNKPIVISNTAKIIVIFGVPVPYLYWMGIIEFFHRLNLHIRCYPRTVATSDDLANFVAGRLVLGCWCAWGDSNSRPLD